MKKNLFEEIERERKKLIEMSDFIFDNPEYGGEEIKAAEVLTNYLEKNGFQVERGIAELPTAFRAIYNKGKGGARIGILCEYDALQGLGHGCGHHMQGPSCVGAAAALKNIIKDKNFSIVVYGTPGEETFGGKLNMLKAGYFKDIDVALMMHGAPDTCTDIKCLAQSSFVVTYHGKRAHAALMPESGRSAFDALLLSFQGIEFMREHVKDDVRMHYTVKELPGPENVVPAKAVGKFSLRSFSREYLDTVVERFKDVIRGAAIMSGVEYELTEGKSLDNKIPVLSLNDLFIKNAEFIGIPGITKPREKTGSTDFGNVMHEIPGSCIRVKFVPTGTSSHSQEYINAGKSEDAHNCVIYGAKAIAGTAYDIINDEKILQKIKEEYITNKKIYK